MASIDDGEIFLAIEGATEAELRAGIVAARLELERSGLPFDKVFAAEWECEGYDCRGKAEAIPQDVRDALGVSYRASAAAAQAAGGRDRLHVRMELCYLSRILEAEKVEREHPGYYADPVRPGPHYQLERARSELGRGGRSDDV
ncbi:hypothetical protein [Novosphingobium sp. Gsoil 351]|uniref:hypothetical protein n=1 Tax=Novosphingobium sp. Gsoil 351 TaxID=2675225 RepID=UPI0012B48625|nr:hypothetical protein [Novosphingobium sp. Gsoil 351]QGN54070.1 hypothetical protein GKE62_05460 [Novosphingobium sp. Gsoil 351]